MKVLIIKRADGGVSIGEMLEEVNAEEEVEKWKSGVDPSWLPCTFEVRDSAAGIPTDRTFRNAWTFSGGAVSHDIEKCRGILKNRLRAERVSHFHALDVELFKALETGDSVSCAQIALKKQALRDVTQAPLVLWASTPEAMAVITLESALRDLATGK